MKEYTRENPVAQFYPIDGKWHLKIDGEKPVLAKNLDFVINLFEISGMLDPSNYLIKIIWDHDEFCFYFNNSEEIFNVREFTNGTKDGMALRSIQDLALGFILSLDDEAAEKFFEVFFDFTEE